MLRTHPTICIGGAKEFGFSLIELMIGISILAILMSVALPSFRTWTQDTKVRNAAEAIKNGMMQARAEAISRNANVEFGLIGTTSEWQACLSPCSTNASFATRKANDGSKGVTLVSSSTTLGAATKVTFNFLGLVAPNVDGSGQLAVVDVTAPGNSRNMRVTVGTQAAPPLGVYSGNMPKMCDPNPSAPISTRC